MPDSLAPSLSAAERKATADRLWKTIEMIRRGRASWEIEEALLLTVREIEPLCAQYEETVHVG